MANEGINILKPVTIAVRKVFALLILLLQISVNVFTSSSSKSAKLSSLEDSQDNILDVKSQIIRITQQPQVVISGVFMSKNKTLI